MERGYCTTKFALMVVPRTVTMLLPHFEYIMFTTPTRGRQKDGTGKLIIWKAHTVLAHTKGD